MQNQEEYSEQLYTEDELLLQVKAAIAAKGMPEVSIAPGYGRLLTMLVTLSRSANLLEIGALGGYSGICLCRGLTQEGRLTSLELKADYAEPGTEPSAAGGLRGPGGIPDRPCTGQPEAA